MSDTLKEFARTKILEGLNDLPETWQEKFKLMYGRQGGHRSVEDAVAMSLEDIVKEMPEEKLDWAMQQIERSIKQLSMKQDEE